MLSIDDAHVLLDEVSAELPDEFWNELNGGVCLLPDTRLSAEALEEDLYILGQYSFSSVTGRCIYIYYGSIQKCYGDVSREQLKKELRRILFHEFTHHVESLAGERGLEIKDEQQMATYRKKHQDSDAHNS